MPTRATSSPAASRTWGSSMKVAIWPKRGERKGSRGSCILQHGLETGDGAGERGDLLGRVVHGEAGTRSPDDAEPSHERLGTVVAGPDRDALGVEQRRSAESKNPCLLDGVQRLLALR